MNWGKIVLQSITASIIITVIIGILQLGVTQIGIGWFSLYPASLLGASFWGLPYGWLKRIIYPSSSYEIISLYLLYDIIIWFIISFVIVTLRRMR